MKPSQHVEIHLGSDTDTDESFLTRLEKTSSKATNINLPGTAKKAASQEQSKPGSREHSKPASREQSVSRPSKPSKKSVEDEAQALKSTSHPLPTPIITVSDLLPTYPSKKRKADSPATLPDQLPKTKAPRKEHGKDDNRHRSSPSVKTWMTSEALHAAQTNVAWKKLEQTTGMTVAQDGQVSRAPPMSIPQPQTVSVPMDLPLQMPVPVKGQAMSDPHSPAPGSTFAPAFEPGSLPPKQPKIGPQADPRGFPARKSSHPASQTGTHPHNAMPQPAAQYHGQHNGHQYPASTMHHASLHGQQSNVNYPYNLHLPSCYLGPTFRQFPSQGPPPVPAPHHVLASQPHTSHYGNSSPMLNSNGHPTAGNLMFTPFQAPHSPGMAGPYPYPFSYPHGTPATGPGPTPASTPAPVPAQSTSHTNYQQIQHLHHAPQPKIELPKPESKSPWTTSLLTDFAMTLQKSFPFTQFAQEHRVHPKEVFNMFSALVHAPILDFPRARRKVDEWRKMQEGRNGP